LAVLYADIDAFTKFVEDSLASATQAQAVRILHVIRKEMRDVLNDFGGRKLRYIGDCIQGLLVEGTAQTTDDQETVRSMALCAAAMRSSFELIQAEIPDAKKLGLQIGFELGTTAVSRVGVQGARDRIAISHTSFQAEEEQARCSGSETAIGPTAYAAASSPLREAFGTSRKAGDIDYDRLCARLRRGGGGSGAALAGTGAIIPDAIRGRAYAK
jgi:class 3 adenylate cyclase